MCVHAVVCVCATINCAACACEKETVKQVSEKTEREEKQTEKSPKTENKLETVSYFPSLK